MTLKDILVATDFTEASATALAFGRELARAFGGTLHVLHVVGNIVGEASDVEGYTTDFVALQREAELAGRKQLDAVVTEEDRRTLAAKAIVVTSSTPAQAIVTYANDAHINLIVVGTHDRGAVAHLFLGSVAERVVRSAPCPVLTVRGAAIESPSGETPQAALHT